MSAATQDWVPDRPGATGGAVVVPATGSASSVCCLRSFGRRDIPTVSVSERETPPSFWSRYCEETVTVPSFEDDAVAYKDALLSLARRTDVRAIVPLREMDVYVLAKYREEFADHLRQVWPSMETLRTAHDRVPLVEAAEAAGVAVPETRVLSSVEDWSGEQIIKARYAVLADEYVEEYSVSDHGLGGGTVHLEPGASPDPREVRESMGHDPIVQSYVPGEEYALWALYDHGEPVVTCQKRQLRGVEYSGGTSVCRETVSIPELEAAGRALLDHLEWHGPAAVQMIRDDRTGEFTLLEVNPRFWVSLSCAVRAGVDFPYHYWRLAGGESVRPDSAYENGVATRRLTGEFAYLHSVLGADDSNADAPRFSAAAREVVSSIVDRPNFDYLTADDPGPFVRDLLNQVDGLVGPLRIRSTVESDDASSSRPTP